MRMRIAKNAALVVIDVQKGFDSKRIWGHSNNPGAESNIVALCELWKSAGRPLVCVRHSSANALSPLAPCCSGWKVKPELAKLPFDLIIDKSVNSAFLGKPNLHEWLSRNQIEQIVLVGIQTNMCVETTARMGGNLGYDVIVPLDATRTFDLKDSEGVVTADELSRITSLNLSAGKFAKIVKTADLTGIK